MPRGKVKWFNPEKKYGFITLEDESADVFVHQSGILDNQKIAEGDVVEFEITKGKKGEQAASVIKAV